MIKRSVLWSTNPIAAVNFKQQNSKLNKRRLWRHR